MRHRATWVSPSHEFRLRIIRGAGSARTSSPCSPTMNRYIQTQLVLILAGLLCSRACLLYPCTSCPSLVDSISNQAQFSQASTPSYCPCVEISATGEQAPTATPVSTPAEKPPKARKPRPPPRRRRPQSIEVVVPTARPVVPGYEVPVEGQCGGKGYDGPTKCESLPGATVKCMYISPVFSQCRLMDS